MNRKKHDSEASFNAGLAGRLAGAAAAAGPTTANGGMHMTPAPKGPSRSLDQLLEDDVPAPAPILPTSGLSTGSAPASGGVVQLPVQLVVDSPWQPRSRYDETELQTLGQALKDRGQDEPIKVRQVKSQQFELISGHRRIRAARLIGWAMIDAIIVQMEDRAAEVATLVSNESQVSLSDYERAKAYQQALDHGLAKDQKEVARLFSCSQSRVSQCLTLYKLPAPILALLDKYPDLFQYRHAKVLLELLKAFPDGLEAIVAATEKMIDNPDLEADELRVQVEKALQPKRARPKALEPRLITDKNGASAFSVKMHPRQIVINIEDGVDVEMAGKRTLAALREFAQALELPEKEKPLKTKT